MFVENISTLFCAFRYFYVLMNLQFPAVSEVMPLLFSEADISSLEIAFRKAVMLPPEIATFCDAVFFNSETSFMSSVNQPNQTSLWFVTIIPLYT